jgi:hypothetical protein
MRSLPSRSDSSWTAAGVRIAPDAGRLQGLADDPGDVACLVGVAGDRRQVGALVLEQLAQAGPGLELAGLDHDQGVGFRPVEGVAERVGGAVAGVAQADQAAPAHQRPGRGLVGQPGRIGLGLLAGQHGDVEGIGEVRHHGAAETLGGLPNLAAVGPVDQDAAEPGRRPLDEAVELARLDLHPPRLKNSPRRRRMSSAMPVTTRRRASSSACSEANSDELIE